MLIFVSSYKCNNFSYRYSLFTQKYFNRSGHIRHRQYKKKRPAANLFAPAPFRFPVYEQHCVNLPVPPYW